MQVVAIKVKQSGRFMLLVAAIHVLAALAVVISGIPLILKLAALLLAGLCCLIFIGKYRRALRLCSSISYHDDIASQKHKSLPESSWRITNQQGRQQEVRLQEHNILLDFYISLVFVTKNRSRKLYVPLLRADIGEESFRALKVLLRYSND